MCGFGWLVPAISWKLIAWVWAYNLVWMFVLGGVRLGDRAACSTTAPRARAERELVSQSLSRTSPPAAPASRPEKGGRPWTTARS